MWSTCTMHLPLSCCQVRGRAQRVVAQRVRPVHGDAPVHTSISPAARMSVMLSLAAAALRPAERVVAPQVHLQPRPLIMSSLSCMSERTCLHGRTAVARRKLSCSRALHTHGSLAMRASDVRALIASS